jgi:hypothetical protein
MHIWATNASTTLRSTIERLQSMDMLSADGGELGLKPSTEASMDVVVDALP